MTTKIHPDLLRLKTLTEQCIESQDIFSDEIIVYSACVGPLLSLERWVDDDICFISIAGGMTNRGATYHHFPVKRSNVIAWHEKRLSLQALVNGSFFDYGGHLVVYMGLSANGAVVPASVEVATDLSLYALRILNPDPDLYWYVSDKKPLEVSRQYDMNTLQPITPTQSKTKMKTNQEIIESIVGQNNHQAETLTLLLDEKDGQIAKLQKQLDSLHKYGPREVSQLESKIDALITKVEAFTPGS